MTSSRPNLETMKWAYRCGFVISPGVRTIKLMWGIPEWLWLRIFLAISKRNDAFAGRMFNLLGCIKKAQASDIRLTHGKSDEDAGIQ